MNVLRTQVKAVRLPPNALGLSCPATSLLVWNQWLFDRAMDALDASHDRKTLRSCTLVCRAWLPRARHHLFAGASAVHLRVYDITEDGCLDPTLENFLNFVLTPVSPPAYCGSLHTEYVVADLVTSLRVSGPYPAGHVFPGFVCLSALHALLDILPHLQVLRLNGLKIGIDSLPPAPSQRLGTTRELRVLALKDVFAFSTALWSRDLAVHALLAPFARVGTLCVGSSRSGMEELVPEDRAAPFGSDVLDAGWFPSHAAVGVLDVQGVSVARYLALVLTTPMVYALKGLTVDCASESDFVALRAFLCHGVVGSTLTRLEIEFTSYCDLTMVLKGCQLADLTTCRRLESLTLKHDVCEHLDGAMNTTFAFLEFPPPPTLTSFTVEFSFGALPYSADGDLKQDVLRELANAHFDWLDAALIDWQALQEVNIVVTVDAAVARANCMLHRLSVQSMLLSICGKANFNESVLETFGEALMDVVQRKMVRLQSRKKILNVTISYMSSGKTKGAS